MIKRRRSKDKIRRGNMGFLENRLKIAKISSAEKKSFKITGKYGSKGWGLRVRMLQRKTKGDSRWEESKSNRDWERSIGGYPKEII